MVKTGSRYWPLWGLLFSILLLGPVAAAEVSVSAEVDRNTVGLGGSFVLRLSVSSSSRVQIEPPRLPTIGKVQLVHQQQSSQTSSSVVSKGHGIETQTVRTTNYSYQFSAQALGRVSIDPIVVQVEGKVYKTQALTVTVVAAGTEPSQKPRSRRRGIFGNDDPFEKMEEMFNKNLQRGFGGLGNLFGRREAQPQQQEVDNTTIPGIENQPFFIVAEVDKTEAFKGEQVMASWYLYTYADASIGSLDTLKYPTLKGFWKEDIQISTVLQFRPENVNGRRYKKALLTSYALFPIAKGKAQIDAYEAKAMVMRGFGFAQRQSFTQSSEMIPIFVKALPEEGRPEEFQGAVGSFRMRAEVVDKAVVENQPFALKIRFDGEGNAKLIELPQLNLPEGLEVYDTSNESQFFKNGQSYKEFTILVVPRKSGEITLPSFQSAAFDPKQQKYIQLRTQPLPITVSPGSASQGIADQRLQSEGPEIVEKALPKIAAEWDPSFRGGFWPWWLSPSALLGVLLVLLGRLIFTLGWFRKSVDITDEVQKRFEAIGRRIEKQEFRDVGIDVTNATYAVLGELSGLGGANVELPKLMAKIPPSVRRETEVPITRLMDYFGVLGFGPQKVLKDASVTGAAEKNVKDIEALLLQAIKLSQGSSDGSQE